MFSSVNRMQQNRNSTGKAMELILYYISYISLVKQHHKGNSKEKHSVHFASVFAHYKGIFPSLSDCNKIHFAKITQSQYCCLHIIE